VAWRAATRIIAGVGDLVQRTGDGQAQVRYSVAGWSRGWVTLCAVYTVYEETRSACFFVEPQNQGWRFVSGLTSKPLGWFVSGLTSNPLGRFLRFSLKAGGDGFSWFGLKTDGDEFPGLCLKTSSYGLVILASKSLRRFLGLGFKTKRASVCWLRNKIDGRMKTT
jgi:hypothetical protein